MDRWAGGKRELNRSDHKCGKRGTGLNLREHEPSDPPERERLFEASEKNSRTRENYFVGLAGRLTHGLSREGRETYLSRLGGERMSKPARPSAKEEDEPVEVAWPRVCEEKKVSLKTRGRSEECWNLRRGGEAAG